MGRFEVHFCPRHTWDGNALSLFGDQMFSIAFLSQTHLGRKCLITAEIRHWTFSMDWEIGSNFTQSSEVQYPISNTALCCMEQYSSTQNSAALQQAIQHCTEPYGTALCNTSLHRILQLRFSGLSNEHELSSCRWDTLLLSSKQLDIAVDSTSLSEWASEYWSGQRTLVDGYTKHTRLPKKNWRGPKNL